jgi:hypothetical protein
MVCRRYLCKGTLFYVSNIAWHFLLAHLLYKLQLLGGPPTYTGWNSGRKWQKILTDSMEQSSFKSQQFSGQSWHSPNFMQHKCLLPCWQQHHLLPSWITLIQSTSSYHISWWSILTLSSHLHLCFPSDFFSFQFHIKTNGIGQLK